MNQPSAHCPRALPSPSRRGFTLIELSIVMVIIGLIVGAILSGRALIQAATLRSVTTDANAYIAAVSNFRSQYRYLPGDMPNAANYWAGSTSGNGDGQVNGTERFQLWAHLSNAAMIEPKLTGATGSGGGNDFVIGSNIPAARLTSSGFSFYYANMAASGTVYTVTMGNMLALGKAVGVNSGEPINAVLTPDDAHNIDTKTDDGMPGRGNWIANGTGGGNFGTATACTASTSGTDYTGRYNLINTATSCGFFIKSGF